MSDLFTIIGGGVCGLAMAAELSSRGAQVMVIDPKGAPGDHACSWWAGGMLAPDCEGVSAEPEIVRQGGKAASWWESHGGIVHHAGTIVVALNRDQSDLATFARRAPTATSLSKTQIAEHEPHLAERFSKALFLADEGHLDPRATLTALHARLDQKGVRFGGEIKGQVIDCRGLAARDTLTDLRGVKGEMLVVRCPDVTLSRPVRLLHPRLPLYIVPRGDCIFMLGATMVEGHAGKHVTARALLELLSAAYALNPAFGEAEVIETGVDSRPAFPDNLPRIRRDGNLISANGLFRHGFLLAPALARMVADLIFDNKNPEVMDETAA